MTVSFAEAMDLLLKWKSESSPILAAVDSPDGFTFKLSGSIAAVYPHGFVITRITKPPLVAADLVAVLVDAHSFEYQDMREARKPLREQFEGIILGLLTFRMRGSTVILYELQGRT
jgi:hypothetical protein